MRATVRVERGAAALRFPGGLAIPLRSLNDMPDLRRDAHHGIDDSRPGEQYRQSQKSIGPPIGDRPGNAKNQRKKPQKTECAHANATEARRFAFLRSAGFDHLSRYRNKPERRPHAKAGAAGWALRCLIVTHLAGALWTGRHALRATAGVDPRRTACQASQLTSAAIMTPHFDPESASPTSGQAFDVFALFSSLKSVRNKPYPSEIQDAKRITQVHPGAAPPPYGIALKTNNTGTATRYAPTPSSPRRSQRR
ncbi:MAG: hypothetical protein K0S57_3515 [Ramlibacter sp.]|nr:hypothetical protein [Ramlibacter sp.]